MGATGATGASGPRGLTGQTGPVGPFGLEGLPGKQPSCWQCLGSMGMWASVCTCEMDKGKYIPSVVLFNNTSNERFLMGECSKIVLIDKVEIKS